MEKFIKYSWPGNIRELENFSERLVISEEKMSDEEGFIERFLLQTQDQAFPPSCTIKNDDEDLYQKSRSKGLIK
jgi:DNA-binding NtrC family response regulator